MKLGSNSRMKFFRTFGARRALTASLFLATALFSVNGFSSDSSSGESALPLVQGFSAARPLSKPASTFIDAALQKIQTKKKAPAFVAETALERKTSLNNADWDRVPEVTLAALESSFKSVRDTKFFTDEDGRSRRATWLYPDDGCFVRATAAAEHLESDFALESAKIFAFGDLEVKTENSPQGSVGWWYHVAAISKVVDPQTGQIQVFVYDPAIQPSAPMKVSEWLDAMNAPKAEISVCSGGTYDPGSDCDALITAPSRRAQREVHWFLPSEWWRMEELGRDPEKELGDLPPWQTPKAFGRPIVSGR